MLFSIECRSAGQFSTLPYRFFYIVTVNLTLLASANLAPPRETTYNGRGYPPTTRVTRAGAIVKEALEPPE